MKIKSYWLFFVLSALSVCAFVGFLAWNEIQHATRHAPQVSLEKPVPNFSFAAHNGSTVSRAELLGKVWIADFIFTSCPGPCLKMSAQMKEIQDALARENDVRLVSFTVNPEMDTPEVLAAYGKKFGAGPNWFFLTGSKKELYDLAEKGFLLAAVDTNDGSGRLEDKFIHSEKFALVDRSGNIRAYFDGADPTTPQKLAAAARHWLAN